jgi:hypothetical protein
MTYPVMLGAGERLFPDRPEALHLTLLSAQSFESGIVVLVYQPVRCIGPQDPEELAIAEVGVPHRRCPGVTLSVRCGQRQPALALRAGHESQL